MNLFLASWFAEGESFPTVQCLSSLALTELQLTNYFLLHKANVAASFAVILYRTLDYRRSRSFFLKSCTGSQGLDNSGKDQKIILSFQQRLSVLRINEAWTLHFASEIILGFPFVLMNTKNRFNTHHILRHTLSTLTCYEYAWPLSQQSLQEMSDVYCMWALLSLRRCRQCADHCIVHQPECADFAFLLQDQLSPGLSHLQQKMIILISLFPVWSSTPLEDSLLAAWGF